MTVNELMQKLEELIESGVCTGDEDIRLQTQSNYPLEYDVEYGVTTRNRINEQNAMDKAHENGEDECVLEDFELADENIVYLCEGRQIGYGDKIAWEIIE